ncbi:Ig-like domain-containing protein [Chloroflexota bacterium]
MKTSGSGQSNPIQAISEGDHYELDSVIDTNGDLHITWYSPFLDESSTFWQRIFYAYYNGIDWSALEEVTNRISGNYPDCPSIITNSSGCPSVIWEDSSDGSVFYKQWNVTKWSSKTKINLDSQYVGQGSSCIDISDIDHVYVLWTSGYNGHSEVFYNHADISQDTIPPEVTLTAPSEGEQLSIGASYAITWNSMDNVGTSTVDLEYTVDDGTHYTGIATSISDEGFYQWNVPDSVSDTIQIRITVSDASGSSGFNISDYFSISDRAPPIISVTSANGGEVWETGSQHDITWEAWDNVGVSSISLLYSIDDGSTWTSIVSGQSNSGAYPWIAPNKPASTYKVKVIALDIENNQGEDISDSTFTIISSNNPANTPSGPSPGDEASNISISTDLSWNGGDPDPGDTVTYDVYFGTIADPSLVASGQTEIIYDLGTLEYQKYYFWKIVASDSHGLSISSPVWSFFTELEPAPAPPSSSEATVTSAAQIDLEWVDNSDNEIGFKIERKIGTDDSFTLIDVAPFDSTSFSDINLTESGTYYYRIRAYNSTGNSAYNESNMVSLLIVLESIEIIPSSPTIVAGRTQYFTATGTYSDASTANLSSSVTWISSDTSVARIYSNGLVRSYTVGTTLITATTGNCTDNTTLTVGAAVLDSVTVTPTNPSVTFVSDSPPTRQFVATGIYSDGTSSIITGSSSWLSSNTGVAAINPGTGLATTVSAGTTSINATYSGKIGYTILTVHADTVAPKVTLTSPKDGQVLSSTTVNVTGSVNDLAATANVTVNGGTPISLTIGGNGSFNQSVSTLTANSSNTILVRATDPAGNTGTSGTITVTVSPTKPGITITQPSSGLITDNASQTVSGTVSGNISAVNLVTNGTSQTVSVTAGSFTANVTLSEGTNIIVVSAYTSGHSSDSTYLGTSGLVTVTLDTTPPVVSVDTPASGSVVSSAACEVSGTIDDPDVSTANLTLNGTSQLIPVSSGNFSQSVTLVSGSNTITVTATDEAGNTSTATDITVTFDNTKPEITITSPVSGTVTNTANRNVSGTVSDPSISTATLYLNSSPQAISVTDGSYSENVTLSSGANILEVRASDNATNTGTSGNVTITLDNTVPTITIGLSDPTDSITITVESNEALSSAPTVTVNPTVTMEQTGINTWTGTYGNSGSPITSGNYTVTANATDRAGNNRVKTATFCKETITVSENATVTVGTSTTTLQIDTTADVTDASISVTQHIDSPSGNAGNPSGAGLSAGVFLEIVASPELRDNLEGIYIEVSYDPADLPAGTDEATLKLYLWDVATGTWQVVSGSGVNTTTHIIYGTVTHLSQFGGFGTVTVPPAAPSSPPAGGGGGGGGTPAGWTRLSAVIDSAGIFTADAIAQSEDKQCNLQIETGVKALDKYGNKFTSIIMLEDDSPPTPPENNELVGKVYEIDPSGATFEPAIIMTMGYDTGTLSENVSEETMYIAYWTGTEWSAFESTVNTETHTVSAETTHFTKFALIGKPPEPKEPSKTTSTSSTYTKPARFEVSDLSVTPGSIKSGETVTISVTVTNTGDKSGSYTAVLTINATEENSKVVSLGAGKSESVTFTVSRNIEGTYEIEVAGETGSFTVVPTTGAIIIPEDKILDETDVKTTNWRLIGIIAGSCILIIGLGGYLLYRRRRDA